MDFSIFDARGYPTVSVVEGYGEWADSYEGSVLDEMDIRLLARLATVEWSRVARAADLACGTGRTGAWLRDRGVRGIDGVDVTPEMLDRARTRGVYAALHRADMRATPLPGGVYDLCAAALADEHVPDLLPLYAEAARLLAPEGRFVIVGYHPHFVMTGMPTHYHRDDGAPVAIETYVHLFSDHVKAARGSGLDLEEMEEGVIDEAWIAAKPKWREHEGRPISFAMVWRKAGVDDA